jgi:NTE family protein
MPEDVLASPAIGTSANDLITPCAQADPQPAPPPAPAAPPAFAVALSGGGFRATLSGLGVIRFLADAGLLGRMRYSSSVSGGSLANGLVAAAYPQLKQGGFARATLDDQVIRPFARKISSESLKARLLRSSWRIVGPRTRTDLLTDTFDDWWFQGLRLSQLSPDCRWIFNAANLTTGVRFGFERDVVGDYVMGRVSTGASDFRVAQAVAASAAVPGAFARMGLGDVPFPCANGREAQLLDGGVYDNMGLEPLDDLRDTCIVALNAGGVMQVGRLGSVPLVRDLQRSNALLYRQTTALRRRHMVDRFKAWEQARQRGEQPPDFGRQGVLFSLATSFQASDEWLNGRPEREQDREELALVKTSFDKFPSELCDRLIYRGWWLAGANLATYHRKLLPAKLPAWEPL